jgi:hypothetical protein
MDFENDFCEEWYRAMKRQLVVWASGPSSILTLPNRPELKAIGSTTHWQSDSEI